MMALPQVMMALPLGLQETDNPDPQAKPVCDIPAGKVLREMMPHPFPGMGLVQGRFEQHIIFTGLREGSRGKLSI